MTRHKAMKGLFISIAASVAIFILREQLAEIAMDVFEGTDNTLFGERIDYAWSNFFENRWALAVGMMLVTYFAYRVAVAPRNPD